MNSEPQIDAGSGSSPVGEHQADTRTPVFASLRQSATLEFHASVQLLAERARFLTGAAGVAVALEQGGQFVYCAATGSSVPETDTTADITRYPLRKCIKTGQAVRLSIEHLSIEAFGEGPHPALAVPVLKDEKVVGFFELAPSETAFEEADVEAISRLAVMVSTAFDHLDAAEHTEKLIAEAKFEAPTPPAGPVLWHAPEPDASQPTPDENSHPPVPADVHPCTACGFPVSGRRTLCLDCEKHDCEKHQDDPKSGPQADLSPAAEMFATEPQESWISAYGYTIASLLVTALAAAIILWLR